MARRDPKVALSLLHLFSHDPDAPRKILPHVERSLLFSEDFLWQAYSLSSGISEVLYEIDPSIIATEQRILELARPSHGWIWNLVRRKGPAKATAELAMSIFERCPEAAKYFDAPMQRLERFADLAVHHLDRRALQRSDPKFLAEAPRLDRLVEAFRLNKISIYYLPLALQVHPAIVSVDVARDWKNAPMIVHASKSGMRNFSIGTDLAAAMLEANPLTWRGLSPALQIEMAKVRPDLTKAYDDLNRELEELDLTFLPDRVHSIKAVRKLIDNRRHPERADGRPLAVVLYPTTDHNGAFRWNTIEDMMQAHRVIYYEVSRDRCLPELLRHATAAEPATLVEIGAHGDQGSMQLSGSPYFALRPSRFLDLGDEGWLSRSGMRACVAPGARIVLRSCSTGRGGRTARNVANMMSRIVPQAWIYAPMAPACTRMTFDDDGRWKDVYAHDAEILVINPAAWAGLK